MRKLPFKLVLFFILIFLSQISIAQWRDKVAFSYSLEKLNDKEAIIKINAKIVPHWHLYSVNHDPSQADGTGVAFNTIFPKSPNYKLIGKTVDGLKAKTVKDDMGTSLWFEGKALFTQKIEILTDKPFDLIFDINGQTCDEMGCLFIDDEVKIKVSGFKPAKTVVPEPQSAVKEDIEEKKSASVISPDTASSQGKSGNDAVIKKNNDKEIVETDKKETKKDSNWVIFIAGFLGGLVALFTPCMFPMIPMTVTFFTKQSKTRSQGIFKALTYGLSIIVIYVTFGLVFTAIAGPIGLNDLSTNIWMNIIFFLIFILFAFSFLGAFEIQLPNSWVNKMDKQADRGGMIGVFFMAFTLGLVSFSCTGPIVGTLLVEAATSGSYYTPAVGMIGFSLALAIPFTLFAIFPGWLNSLPQSGGWLNSVKVVLGLLELALALKFLSAVDLAYHWDILSREWFVGIWFVLFLIMGIYLLGKLRFSHDSPVEKLSVTRFMFAVLALVFSIYLFPGMFGAPLKVIDGIAPPRTHSEDNFRFINGGLDTGLAKDSINLKFASEMHPVADGSILVFHDFDRAKEYAKLKNLPILLDFTGHACQNCRKTESSVWTHDEIRPLLQTKFVIASLYVDDREPLPESEVRYSEVTQGKIKTVGNKWAELEIQRYDKFAQPLYVVTDSDGNDLTEAIPYTPDITEYRAFLMKGIKRFNKMK